MQNLNKFNPWVVTNASSASNCQENSSIKWGSIMNLLSSRKSRRHFVSCNVCNEKLIRIRNFLSNCKDKFGNSSSGKRLQANVKGIGKPNIIQYALPDSGCSNLGNGEELISGKMVSAGKPFRLLKFVQRFVPFNLARNLLVLATVFVLVNVSILSFHSGASARVWIHLENGFDGTITLDGGEIVGNTFQVGTVRDTFSGGGSNSGKIEEYLNGSRIAEGEYDSYENHVDDNKFRPFSNSGNSKEYCYGKDGRGVLLSMSPIWRNAESSVERFIWQSELTGVANDSLVSTEGRRFEAEIGYGFDVLDDSMVITPFHAYKQSSNNGSELHVGSRFATDSGHFELVAVMNIPRTEIVGHGFNLTGTINW